MIVKLIQVDFNTIEMHFLQNHFLRLIIEPKIIVYKIYFC